MRVLLASNNVGKVDRFRRLLRSVDQSIELLLPGDVGIPVVEVEENAMTLIQNAELKARGYAGTVEIPILANDTGFYVAGEGFVIAPKREALGGDDERELTKEEVSQRVLEFWKGIAKKQGGRVDAAWIEGFVVLYPDGSLERAESRREIILTTEEFASPPLDMPVRALYISRITDKPAILHTPEEEKFELQPIVTVLRSVLRLTGEQR